MTWELLPTDARNAVLLSERFADGRATEPDLRAAAVRLTHAVAAHHHATNAAGWASVGRWEPAPALGWDITVMNPAEAARSAAKALATRVAGTAPPGGNPVSATWQATWNGAYFAARAHQAELVRDVFPPPGYTPVLRPDWQTST